MGRTLAIMALLGFCVGCGAILTSQENAKYVGPVDDTFDYDTPPTFAVTVRPEYPDMAREIGVHGRVVLKVLVGEDGRVTLIEILESPSPILDDEAITAVRKSVFVPAMKNGSPCPASMVIPFIFDREDTYVRDRMGLEVDRTGVADTIEPPRLPEPSQPDLSRDK